MHDFRHRNIVSLIAMTSELGHYGLVFEYVKYGQLDSFVDLYVVRFLLCVCDNDVHVQFLVGYSPGFAGEGASNESGVVENGEFIFFRSIC